MKMTADKLMDAIKADSEAIRHLAVGMGNGLESIDTYSVKSTIAKIAQKYGVAVEPTGREMKAFAAGLESITEEIVYATHPSARDTQAGLESIVDKIKTTLGKFFGKTDSVEKKETKSDATTKRRNVISVAKKIDVNKVTFAEGPFSLTLPKKVGFKTNKDIAKITQFTKQLGDAYVALYKKMYQQQQWGIAQLIKAAKMPNNEDRIKFINGLKYTKWSSVEPETFGTEPEETVDTVMLDKSNYSNAVTALEGVDKLDVTISYGTMGGDPRLEGIDIWYYKDMSRWRFLDPATAAKLDEDEENGFDQLGFGMDNIFEDFLNDFCGEALFDYQLTPMEDEITGYVTSMSKQLSSWIASSISGTGNEELDVDIVADGVAVVREVSHHNTDITTNTDTPLRNKPNYVPPADIALAPGVESLTDIQKRYVLVSMQQDFKAIKGSLESIRGVGMESMASHAKCQVLASTMNKRYGANIASTQAGLEGFADALKKTIDGIKGFFKGKDKPIMKKATSWRSTIKSSELADVKKTYLSDAWLDKQTFKEGTVSIKLPKYIEGDDIDSVAASVNKTLPLFTKTCQNVEADCRNVLKKGLVAADKIKKLKITDANFDESLPKVKTIVNEIPDYKDLKDLVTIQDLAEKGKGDSYVGTETKKVTALDKEGVKKAVALMEELFNYTNTVQENHMSLAEESLGEEVFDDYGEWFEEGKHNEAYSKEVAKLINSVFWENVTDNLTEVTWKVENSVYSTMRALESWILASIK